MGTHAKNGGPQKRPLLATDSPPLGVQDAPAPNLVPTVLLLAQDKGKVGAAHFSKNFSFLRRLSLLLDDEEEEGG